jgi:hypothetical protein
MMQKFVLGLAVIAALGTSAAYAQDKDKAQTSPLVEAHDAFVADLNEANTRHFNILYSNYNIVQVVGEVEASIGKAVQSCGENNPDLKERMDTRLDEWSAAVEPVITDVNAHINNMLFAQEYAKPKAIKKIFKLIDKTRKEHRDSVEKVPVSSAEECEALIKRMDKTQDNMTQILRATLISLPGNIQVEQDKKAEADAKAESEAEKAE